MGPWTAADLPDQSGRTALVTGASDGLGLRTAEALAAHGSAVLLGCRNLDKGERAREAVTANATGPAPALVRLDLADLASVRAAAATLTDTVTHLDLLVNNAGIMAVPFARTTDGHELQFATNHLGHFALTGLLLPALLRASDARVVTVTSTLHRLGSTRWDDPDYHDARYRPWPAYGRSKLANLQFAFELGRQAAAAGTRLVSAAAHPGYAATNLVPARSAAIGHRLVGAVSDAVTSAAGQSAVMGALPQLYAATMPDVASGDLFGPDGPFQARGHPRRIEPSPAARDEASAARLWDVSTKLSDVAYPWPP